MAQRSQQREPAAGRAATDECGQRVELQQQLVQIVGPNLVFGIPALERDTGGAAVAPVVDEHAIAGLGDLLPERLDPHQAAPPAGLQGHPRAPLAEHFVINFDPTDGRYRHRCPPPWPSLSNCVILADIDWLRTRGGMIREELVFVATCDISGLVRGKGFPFRELPARLKKGIGWTGSNLMMSPFGPIWDTPFGTAGDFMIVPDPSVEVRVDFADGSAVEHFFLGDICNTDGSAWECCPRDFLRRAAAQLQEVAGLGLDRRLRAGISLHRHPRPSRRCLCSRRFSPPGHFR